MTVRRILLLLLLVGGFFVFPSAWSQDLITINFNVMLWAPFETLAPGVEEPDEPVFWYIDGETPVEIKAEWNNPSEPMHYHGPANLQFYRLRGMIEGQPSLSPFHKVPLPSGAKHVLLIFFLNDQGGYSAFPVDVGLQDMPEGSLKILNFSNDEIAVEIGSSTKVMPNRSSWMVPVSEAGNSQLRMQIATRQNEKWKLIFRTAYAVNEDSRMILFIHRRDFKSGPFRVRRITGFGTVDESVIGPAGE